jgi:hypothetical protein
MHFGPGEWQDVCMDWGTFITGVVGLAGIGGSIVSAKIASKSATGDLRIAISAEDARSRRADKRLIYASFLAALSKLRDLRTNEHRTDEDIKELLAAQTAAWVPVLEVGLVGPPQIATAAQQVYLLVTKNDDDVHKYANAYADLIETMRADLNDQPTYAE